MAKKNKKKDKFKSNPFDYMGGGRIRELGERYGVDHRDYNINGGRTSGGGRDYKGDRDDYDRAVRDAAMRDYDTRRTMEAAAMAGDKKAKKFAKKGFKNVGKVYEANELMRKMHKDEGNGGSFSSPSDFAGLTHSKVKADRDAQTAGYDNKYATNDALNELKEKMMAQAEAKKAEEPVEYVESEEYAAAKRRLSDGTYDTAAFLFNGPTSEPPTTAFRRENEAVPASDDQTRAVNSYLDQYKEDVIKGGRLKQAVTNNLNNAYNTVIRSDI